MKKTKLPKHIKKSALKKFKSLKQSNELLGTSVGKKKKIIYVNTGSKADSEPKQLKLNIKPKKRVIMFKYEVGDIVYLNSNHKKNQKGEIVTIISASEDKTTFKVLSSTGQIVFAFGKQLCPI